MQELVGRLTALDPEASETLKVVAYFDALVVAGAGLDALLRGAAVLSGTIAGAERRGRISRQSPVGKTVTEPESLPRSPQRECAGGTVWLEREGKQHANDEMVVERLALAVDLLEARRNPATDLEIVLDGTRPITERTTALARLRLEPTSRVRVVATRPEAGQHSTALSALVPTPQGILRATLCRGDDVPDAEPAGIGPWAEADHAGESWEGAQIALRLTTPELQVVDAKDLGALILVARSYDPARPHEDVHTLARLDDRSAHILLAIVESDSLRSAAAVLGMHHSTLQAKHESLTKELGYDPRTINGRVRYAAAELLRRLTDPRALR